MICACAVIRARGDLEKAWLRGAVEYLYGTQRRMSGVKVAVVTGSNKGIGLAIVRALCKQYDGAVYLTSRYAIEVSSD